MKLVQVTIKRDCFTHTQVDDQDMELASKRGLFLSKNGYVRTHLYENGKRRKELLHRIIMRPGPGKWVDHINFDKLDNRRDNLRIVTPSQNCQKRRKSKTRGNTRFKGVHFCNTKKRFKVYIRNNCKYVYVGGFSNEIDAAAAYNEAAKKYFGEFAVLNELA